MSGRFPDTTLSFSSHAAFYNAVYGSNIDALHELGGAGATLLTCAQAAGDWSDAPSPDLVLGRLISSEATATIDFGLGRFRAPIRRNVAFLMPPNTGSYTVVEHEHRVQMISIPYNWLLELLGEQADLFPSDGDFGQAHAGYLWDKLLTRVFDTICEEAVTGFASSPIFIEGALLQLAGCFRRLSGGAPSKPLLGGLTPRQFAQARDLMLHDLSEQVRLTEVAQRIGLSAGHFSRAFTQSAGEPPHMWLMRQRIEYAMHLLKADPDVGLTEVAMAVGYSGQSAFGVAFKHITGLTPSAYRRAI